MDIGAHAAAATEAVAANAGGIAANAQAIAGNAGGVAANAQAIQANAGGVAANMRSIEMNSSGIAANRDGIGLNAGNIMSNATAIANLDRRLLDVDERVKQVAAMGAALSAVPNAVSGEGNFFLGVGFGNYEGEQGIAAGFSARLGEARNVVVNAGVASSSGETSVRAGVGYVW